jgi:hypothetical protein
MSQNNGIQKRSEKGCCTSPYSDTRNQCSDSVLLKEFLRSAHLRK